MVGMMETAQESFERLRQALNVIKDNHYDPWCWHEYLGDDPKDALGDDEDEDDIEMVSLKPRVRKNIDRMKSHLLTVVQEMNRAGHAADLAYYHMSVKPELLKECAVIMGSAGDIDSDLLLSSGDGSPAKIMAALQGKLDEANQKIEALTNEVNNLKKRLIDTNYENETRGREWSRWAMLAEEAMGRLDEKSKVLNMTLEREAELQADYDDLYARHVRASRMMLYKGRQMMRDKIFMQNKKENKFYAFQGFIYILQQEKEERIRREQEEMRDSVDFALRNEVRFLLSENKRCNQVVSTITVQVNRLKNDRRALAQRLLHHQRPFETLEYLKWIWELWQPLRSTLRLEKVVEREVAIKEALNQQLISTSNQLLPMTSLMDQLRVDLVNEQLQHDLTRRELVAAGSRQFAALAEGLRVHRNRELSMLMRLFHLDIEEKDERIAVLEREIAEDKHIHALKGMVVDLETNLRRALDRRKQRSYVVPPAAGPKCVQCGRETTFRGWKVPPDGLSRSASEFDLGRSVSASPPPLAPIKKGPDRSPVGRPGVAWADDRPEKEGKFAAGWR
eukprot:TRINITY_DN108226_c0_g1_i1.p1 TRINITY_DN108226_c0_g1~~TRINITY_DN108226_c0_g1_i1.p1  ORF type:complete len:563 (-),score=145.51 TRINITY_DN108226_c0_g1_i1:90-1778(-)